MNNHIRVLKYLINFLLIILISLFALKKELLFLGIKDEILYRCGFPFMTIFHGVKSDAFTFDSMSLEIKNFIINIVILFFVNILIYYDGKIKSANTSAMIVFDWTILISSLTLMIVSVIHPNNLWRYSYFLSVVSILLFFILVIKNIVFLYLKIKENKRSNKRKNGGNPMPLTYD